eukprot:1399895-Heterocapsa_arctica.AAC.1
MEKVSLEAMCDHIMLFKIVKTFRSDAVKVQIAFGNFIYEEEKKVTPSEEPPWRRPPWRTSGFTSRSQLAKAHRRMEDKKKFRA